MSGIDNAKKAMGWLPPNARPACGNCQRAEVELPINVDHKPIHRCGAGAFITPRYAICDKYSPTFMTGGLPK